MSEMLELSALRIMDEKNDILSLTQQAEELRQHISDKKYDYKKLQVDLENDEHSMALLQERIAEIKSSDRALSIQKKSDHEWMQYFRDDKISGIRRGFGKWMDDDDEIAAYMPSISAVQKRTSILDGLNPRETSMGWIALKYNEEDWDRWLAQELVI